MKIDLLAGIREITGTKRAGSRRRDRPAFEQTRKFVVDVVAPEMVVDFDDKELAGAMAKQLVEIMRQNVLSGLRVDGSPAPALAPATIERRAYRLAQALRGGKPAERKWSPYTPREEREVIRNWKKRYKATKLGKFDPTTNPAPGRNLRGVESGLLIKSMVAEPMPPGFRIYFANIRSIRDRNGTAPVWRALGLGGTDSAPVLGRLMRSPAVKKAAGAALRAVVLKQKTAMDLLKELRTSLENVQQLAQTEIE